MSEDNIGKLPDTLLMFRERQKELKKRNEEKRKNSQVIADNSDDYIKDTKTLLVSEIESSLYFSSKVIEKTDDKEEISKRFSNFFTKKEQLLKDVLSILEIDPNQENYKNIVPSLNKSITKIIYDNQNLQSETLIENFKVLCNEVKKNKKIWAGNEKISENLSIRAKISTFESSTLIWNTINSLPFTNNIEETSIKIFSFSIKLSKDIAINWDDDLSSIERQELYIYIIKIVSEIISKHWEYFNLIKLDNSYYTIDKNKVDLKEKIIDIIEPSKVGISKANEFSTNVVDKILELSERYCESFYNLDKVKLSKVRKTIFKKIETISINFIENNKNDIINKIKNDNETNYCENIKIDIENLADDHPPKIIANIDDFFEEVKELIVQAWGAAQGINKFRREK